MFMDLFALMFSVFVLIFVCHYDLLHVNTLNFILGPIQLNLIEYVQIDDYTYMVL